MDMHVAGGRRFAADIDLCDIDERMRPGPMWTGRSVLISRSRLWIRSRRMCYPNASIGAAIHLIDAEPVVLYGAVRRCEYDADSLYDIEIELLSPPSATLLHAIRSASLGQAAA
ncbi:MAG: hypothetical protein AAFR96_08600 [Planctomycetota bacterium]